MTPSRSSGTPPTDAGGPRARQGAGVGTEGGRKRLYAFSTLPKPARVGQGRIDAGDDAPVQGMTDMDDDTAARAQAARATCPFLTAKQTAFHLGIAHATLKALRLAGRGPACRLHGGTWRYHIDDIETWSKARTGGGDHD